MLAQTKSKQLDLDSLSQVEMDGETDTKLIETNSSQPPQAVSSTTTNSNDKTTANSSQSIETTANSAQTSDTTQTSETSTDGGAPSESRPAESTDTVLDEDEAEGREQEDHHFHGATFVQTDKMMEGETGNSNNAVLITGTTHAREVLSSQAPLFIMLKLIH